MAADIFYAFLMYSSHGFQMPSSCWSFHRKKVLPSVSFLVVGGWKYRRKLHFHSSFPFPFLLSFGKITSAKTREEEGREGEIGWKMHIERRRGESRGEKQHKKKQKKNKRSGNCQLPLPETAFAFGISFF